MFRTVPLSINRSFSLNTQQWYMSYRFVVCGSEKLLMMDRVTVRKHIEFYSKNKFENLVHLVGFIIRIYHDARPPERQVPDLVTVHIRILVINQPDAQNLVL